MPIDNFVLFCKSYDKDLYRAKRLADSIDRFNMDEIPFYISVPQKDAAVFSRIFEGNKCILITDEEVMEKTCQVFGAVPEYFSRHLMQQLIKLEFWRLGKAENYAWVDSDSYFITPFQVQDFMCDSEFPYTIRQEYDINQKIEKWKSVPKRVREKRIRDGIQQVETFKALFGHEGKNYDFGVSTPIIWSAKVLRHLHEHYLTPKTKSIFRLLSDYPCETFLYGYYLMHSQCIPIFPKQHMFKNFDYADEFIVSQMRGENEFSISKEFYGICIQSNWALFPEKKRILDRLKNRKQEILAFFSKLYR